MICFSYILNFSLKNAIHPPQKEKIKAYFILLSEENDWRRIGTVTGFISTMTIGCNMFEMMFCGWFMYCIISYGLSLKTNNSPTSRANSSDKPIISSSFRLQSLPRANTSGMAPKQTYSTKTCSIKHAYNIALRLLNWEILSILQVFQEY